MYESLDAIPDKTTCISKMYVLSLPRLFDTSPMFLKLSLSAPFTFVTGPRLGPAKDPPGEKNRIRGYPRAGR